MCFKNMCPKETVFNYEKLDVPYEKGLNFMFNTFYALQTLIKTTTCSMYV